MSELNRYTYIWENANGSLVFDFGIPPGDSPEMMTLYLYSKPNPQSKLFRESVYGRILFTNAIINGFVLNGEVWLNNSGTDHGYIEANLEYGAAPADQQLEGALAEYYYTSVTPVIPVKPFIPVTPYQDPGAVIMQVQENAIPLFPYIDVQGWPALPIGEQELHFVNYPGPATPVAGSFFYVVQQDTSRTAMEQSAVAWIESASFISTPSQLEGPIAYFARLDSLIESMAEWNPLLLLEWMAYELKTNIDDILAYLSSTGYTDQRDEVWQSWFALVMLNGGYRPGVFSMLTRTIVFCHFAETISTAYKASLPPANETANTAPVVEKNNKKTKTKTVKEAADKTDEKREAIIPVATVLTPALPGVRTIESLLHASVLLENPPFPVTIPLPPYTPSTPSSDPANEWVVPYAVGRLQLVNKKLVGYRGGDLAHIENVMCGEKRETKRRKFNRTEEQQNRKETNESQQQNSSTEEKSNFESQAQKAAAESFTQFTYDGLTSTYGGPTTFTLDGSWERLHGNTTPAQSSSSGFAEQVITKTIQRVRRKVEESRLRVQTDESEESTNSVFDNTGGTQNLQGVYRWLNEVYEARVVHYGSRLLLEFMISNPAKTFTAECKRLYGVDLDRPKSLEDFGIKNFQDISFSANGNQNINASSQLADALQYFGVNEWPPEPPENKIVSVILRAGQQLNIPLPEGYAADYAVVTLPVNASVPPSGSTTPVFPLVNGIIGQSAFDSSTIETTTPAAVTDTPFLQVPMHNETGSIAAVLLDILSPQQNAITLPGMSALSAPKTAPPAIPGSTTTPPSPLPVNEMAVSITIGSAPTPATVTAWQLKIFSLLTEAREKKQRDYFALLLTTKENGGRWLPPDLSSLERSALQNDCIGELFNVYDLLTGPPPESPAGQPPNMFTIYEPVVAQFFNDAFEWKELCYSLLNDTKLRGVPANPDAMPGNNLSAFLQADYARVLVPVKPAMSLPVLYFLTTGTVWLGKPAEVPVTAQNIQAAFAVKTENIEAYCHSESAPWFFEVPTSLLVLDPGNGLFMKPDATTIIKH